MTADLTTRPLFGGAITSDIAKEWLDASNLRQVPDNQEVLLSQSNDLTMIVEVLEGVKEGSASNDFEAAIRYHFDSLAKDNDASSSEIQEIYAIPGTSPGQPVLTSGGNLTQSTPTPAPLCLVGHQTVKKFGQSNNQSDKVRIYLALWRFNPAKDIDLVMTLNEPLTETSLANASDDARVAGSVSSQAQDVFFRAASTLKIRDWGLFAQ